MNGINGMNSKHSARLKFEKNGEGFVTLGPLHEQIRDPLKHDLG